jgi:hypothetical protein
MPANVCKLAVLIFTVIFCCMLLFSGGHDLYRCIREENINDTTGYDFIFVLSLILIANSVIFFSIFNMIVIIYKKIKLILLSGAAFALIFILYTVMWSIFFWKMAKNKASMDKMKGYILFFYKKRLYFFFFLTTLI